MTQAKSRIHRLVLVLGMLFLTVGCDQVTKVMARDALKNLRTYRFFSNSLIFQHTENPGAFLSLGAHLPDEVRFWIFTFLVSLVLATTLYLLFRKSNMDFGTTVSLTLLTGGGLGNLIDRVARGTVTDFVHISFGFFKTGIFNVADVAIVTGLLIYVTTTLRSPKEASQS